MPGAGSSSSREPSFLVRWVAGIAATVLAAVLVAWFAGDDGPAKPGELRHYDVNSRVLSFDYPQFLGGVWEREENANLFVKAGGRFDESWISSFRGLAFGDATGFIVIGVTPTPLAARGLSSRYDDAAAGAPAPEDPLADARTLTKEVRWGKELPIEFYVERKKDSIVHVGRTSYGKVASFHVQGQFSLSTWESHQSEIRQSIKSVAINEAIAKDWIVSRVGQLSGDDRKVMEDWLELTKTMMK